MTRDDMKIAVGVEAKRMRDAGERDIFSAFQVAKNKILVEAAEKAETLEGLRAVILAMLTIHGPRG